MFYLEKAGDHRHSNRVHYCLIEIIMDEKNMKKSKSTV